VKREVNRPRGADAPAVELTASLETNPTASHATNAYQTPVMGESKDLGSVTHMGLDNPLHIAFLLILLLLVFGAKRLPEMGRSLGSGMRGFKDSLSGEHTHEPHDGRAATAIPAERPTVPAAGTELS